MFTRDTMMRNHLRSNFFPPVDVTFTQSALDAVDRCNAGEPDHVIAMPNGVELSAAEIVRGLHLDQMLDEDEWDGD